MDALNQSVSSPAASRASMSWLPMVCGITPLAVAVVSYVISVAAGKVPGCMVFLEGCTSISAAGRNEPAIYFFKGTLLPLSMLVLGYWWLAGGWLRELGASAGSARTVRWLGLVATVFFIVYATLLGSDGPAYRFMRRYGVVLYFAFTALAQMYLARGMLRAAPQRLGRIARTQLWVCAALLALGLGVTVPELFVEVPNEIENIVEWNFAVLLHGNVAITWFAWRRTGIALGVAYGPAPDQPK